MDRKSVSFIPNCDPINNGIYHALRTSRSMLIRVKLKLHLHDSIEAPPGTT